MRVSLNKGGAQLMNQNEANRTSYDALRDEILSLTEDECSEILRLLAAADLLYPANYVAD
jgi:hypothetical protein